MSDAEPKDNPKDPLILRCLKAAARVDWRAMLLVLAAIGGFGGAIWNRVDAVLEKAIQGRTQQGVYELLATRMDELSARLEKIELAHAIESPATPKRLDKPAPAPMPVEHGSLPSPVVSEAMAATVMVTEPEYKAANLPSFDQIQQSAKQDRMPELLETSASPR